MNYYNENDRKAAAWLRELIRQGAIAPGVVDERSITDVRPNDLHGFAQCHFFAGIGAWSYALRLAAWPDDRPVWTGSCPCQPFSNAGRGAGFADQRHLWPFWHHLIEQCRPAVVFGEQVASADGLTWLDLVHADLEASGYAVAAADLCAAGVGAPHIRQRLWFVADSSGPGLPARERAAVFGAGRGLEGRAVEQRGGALGGLADTDQSRRTGAGGGREDRTAEHRGLDGPPPAGPPDSRWATADWIFCRDGRWRPVEPGTFPLAHGAPARVASLRGYGNAIVAEVAATFIRAYQDLTQ